MPLHNDTRGWIMTALSGIGMFIVLVIFTLAANVACGVACVFGASFICIDIIVRLFPGKKDFRIQDSDVFLSLSLSLSFGVMVCSTC